MRSLKAKVIGSTLLGTVLVGTIWYSISRPAAEVGVQTPASVPLEQAAQDDAAASTVASVTQAAPSMIPNSTSVPSPVFKDFAHKEDLSRFAHIAQKALLLPADTIARTDLLKDENLIRSLTPLLTTAAQDSSERQLQNSAIDMLLAALQTDSRDVAVGILKDVVANAGVENDAMPQAERQQIAGVKAEVLMALSADPKFQEDITSLFPGPVTGKIWNNIQQRQASNLAESKLSR
jgi:hypothetical protein